VNEELFYIQEGYIPKNISFEWIAGMLEYIPLLDETKKIIQTGDKDLFGLINDQINRPEETFASSFPKVKRCFTFVLAGRQYTKEKAVKQIWKNIQKNKRGTV
jgi:hypothetical protein